MQERFRSPKAVSEAKRLELASLYLLLELSRSDLDEVLDPACNGKILEPLLCWLTERRYVELSADGELTATVKGTEAVATFGERYRVVVDELEVFSAVDLACGEFAYDRVSEFDNALDWDEFLDQERWEDLRLAVATQRGLDPIEVTFLIYVGNGQFGRDENEMWQESLLLGEIWDEIAEVSAEAIDPEELAYVDGGTLVTAPVVLAAMERQGDVVRQRVLAHWGRAP